MELTKENLEKVLQRRVDTIDTRAANISKIMTHSSGFTYTHYESTKKQLLREKENIEHIAETFNIKLK